MLLKKFVLLFSVFVITDFSWIASDAGCKSSKNSRYDDEHPSDTGSSLSKTTQPPTSQPPASSYVKESSTIAAPLARGDEDLEFDDELSFPGHSVSPSPSSHGSITPYVHILDPEAPLPEESGDNSVSGHDSPARIFTSVSQESSVALPKDLVQRGRSGAKIIDNWRGRDEESHPKKFFEPFSDYSPEYDVCVSFFSPWSLKIRLESKDSPLTLFLHQTTPAEIKRRASPIHTITVNHFESAPLIPQSHKLDWRSILHSDIREAIYAKPLLASIFHKIFFPLLSEKLDTRIYIEKAVDNAYKAVKLVEPTYGIIYLFSAQSDQLQMTILECMFTNSSPEQTTVL